MSFLFQCTEQKPIRNTDWIRNTYAGRAGGQDKKFRVLGGAGGKNLKIPNLHSQALFFSAYDRMR